MKHICDDCGKPQPTFRGLLYHRNRFCKKVDTTIGDGNFDDLGEDDALGIKRRRVDQRLRNEPIEHEFNLSELTLNHGIQPGEGNSVSLTDRGTFVTELPKTKFSAEFRLLTGDDEVYLQQSLQKLKKHNLPEASATTLLKCLVVSVNGVEVPSEISNFIDNMPAQDARFLRACVQTVTPNVDMSQERKSCCRRKLCSRFSSAVAGNFNDCRDSRRKTCVQRG